MFFFINFIVAHILNRQKIRPAPAGGVGGESPRDVALVVGLAVGSKLPFKRRVGPAKTHPPVAETPSGGLGTKKRGQKYIQNISDFIEADPPTYLLNPGGSHRPSKEALCVKVVMVVSR